MLSRPVVDLVNELHWLGRRLAVLKRLYQSYELIMMRILQRQRLLRDEAARSPQRPMSMGNIFAEPEFSELRQPTLQSHLGLANFNDTVGIQLSSAAVARFERLLDRIKLYCLSEIEACLTEKESLTFLVISSSPLPSNNLSADWLSTELQSHCPKRHTSRGEVDEDHDPFGQSDNPVFACQPDDGVLLDRTQRRQKCLYN